MPARSSATQGLRWPVLPDPDPLTWRRHCLLQPQIAAGDDSLPSGLHQPTPPRFAGNCTLDLSEMPVNPRGLNEEMKSHINNQPSEVPGVSARNLGTSGTSWLPPMGKPCGHLPREGRLLCLPYMAELRHSARKSLQQCEPPPQLNPATHKHSLRGAATGAATGPTEATDATT